jgi:4-diphosphocytidyl-2-C-methyl-D-erythritol kinase
LLQTQTLKVASPEFYNALEAPALDKYPLLAVFQEFFRENGAAATLMSGSGSTTFAVSASLEAAQALAEKFRTKFGLSNWVTVISSGTPA